SVPDPGDLQISLNLALTNGTFALSGSVLSSATFPSDPIVGSSITGSQGPASPGLVTTNLQQGTRDGKFVATFYPSGNFNVVDFGNVVTWRLDSGPIIYVGDSSGGTFSFSVNNFYIHNSTPYTTATISNDSQNLRGLVLSVSTTTDLSSAIASGSFAS